MKKNMKKTIAMILSAVLAANGAMFSVYADETSEKENLLPGEMPVEDMVAYLEGTLDKEKLEGVHKGIIDYLDYIKAREAVEYACETVGETGQPLLRDLSEDFPAYMKLDAGVYEASAGDTVKIILKVHDVTKDFNYFMARLRYDNDVFEFVSGKAIGEHKKSVTVYECTTIEPVNPNTVICIYDDQEDSKIEPGEETELAEIVLKVKDDAKDGEYALPFFLIDKNELTGGYWTPQESMMYASQGMDMIGALVKVGKGRAASDTDLYPGSATYPDGEYYYIHNKDDTDSFMDNEEIIAKTDAENKALLGDVNCDGIVDLTDLTELSVGLADKKTFEGQSMINADVKKDGKVNLCDLAALKQFLSKRIESLRDVR